MIYFKNSKNEVYAYETIEERNEFGPVDLVAMTEQEIAEHLSPSNQSEIVPEAVTMRQARLALLNADLLDRVELIIQEMTGVEGRAAQIEWEYGSTVYRSSKFVNDLGVKLGLTSEQLDRLFIDASKIG